MKILMIEPLGFSGICYYTASLCRALRPLVEDLTLLTSRHYELDINQEPYTILPLLGGMNRRQSKVLRAFDALRNPFITINVARKVQPDVVHFQDVFIPTIEVTSVALTRRQGIGVVYTVHDVDRFTLLGEQSVGSKLSAIALNRIYHMADQLIVHSQYSANELQSRFKIDGARIMHMPIGVLDVHTAEPLPSQAEARQRLGIASDRIVALFFGSLKKAKGLDYLLRSLPLVVKQLPNFLLIVAGSPRSENTIDYTSIAKDLGLDNFVRFDTRYVPLQKIADYFMACDFVVLPYQKVYQSAVVVTAYAFGRPVVATRVGGLLEVVEDGQTGYLIDDPTDTKLLADAIIKMGSDRSERSRMGSNAKTVAYTKYSWSTIARETSDIYTALASGMSNSSLDK
jgi:glycosyltransferase involved in cell wall biosynthesis